MTWDTVTGERTLKGAEARLFATCLSVMISEDKDDEGMHDNEPLVNGPYENLSPAQKYTVMEDVAKALLHDTADVPELTAVNESAIYYVFLWLKNRVDVFDGELKTVWGPLILNALDEDVIIWGLEEDGNEGLDGYEKQESIKPCAKSQDLDTWEFAIDCLSDKILWNTDFEMHEHPMFDKAVEAKFEPDADPMSDESGFPHFDYDAYFNSDTGPAKWGSKRRLLACVHDFKAAYRSS